MIINFFRKDLINFYHYIIKNNSIFGIDLFRTFAILFVIFFHLSSMNFMDKSMPKELFMFLWIGVDMFFVISGFLIFNMLISDIEKNGGINLFSFLKRRYLRTYPLYAFVFLFHFIIFYNSDYNIKDIFINLVFLHSYVITPVFMHVGGSWSLIVEEFFYLISPFIVFFMFKLNKIRYYIILFLILSSVLLNLYLTRNNIEDDANMFFAYHFMKPHFRWIELFFGGFLAYLIRSFNFNLFIRRFSLFFGLLILFFIWLYLFNNNFLFYPQKLTKATVYLPFLLGLSFFLILIFFIDLNPFKNGYLNTIVAVIAKISYSLYLIHILIYQIALKYSLSFSTFTYIILFFLGSLITAYCIEYQFLKLYKKELNG